MRDYVEAIKNFSTTELEKAVLHGSLSTGLNACVECCDRWSDLLPTSRTKVMEQSPLISENSGYETIQIYR